MLVYPAIDLRGGKCVRLRQGDYAQETVFGDDPVAIAERWLRAGATWLHLVDLDGAREGRPINGDAARRIVEATEASCQLGGGLRTDTDIEEVLSWGVARVILGTRALKEPEWLKAVCQRFPDKIVLGLDARDGQVTTDGWTSVSEHSALEVARRCSAWPLAALVYTDICRDGMMKGPNLDALEEIASMVSIPVIASGGVTSLDDVRRLGKLGVAGCIIGRALYEGRIDLAEAIKAVSQSSVLDGVAQSSPDGEKSLG